MPAEELRDRFEYHPPDSEKIVTHGVIRRECFNLAAHLAQLLPECREGDEALKSIEQAMFWANAAIARRGYAPEAPRG